MKKKHRLFMILCCLVPLIGLGVIFLFQVPVNQAVYLGLILFCPLSHLLMMKFMMDDGENDHSHSHPPHSKAGQGKLPVNLNQDK